MPLNEAITFVTKWRVQQLHKTNLGNKDRAMVTLCHEVIRLNTLINELSAPFKQARDNFIV